jgi:hypothetical protein
MRAIKLLSAVTACLRYRRHLTEDVHSFETPDAQKLSGANSTSSGRLIHAASGSRGALGGFLKRSGCVERHFR